MARFVAIGYAYREGYENTDPALRDAAPEHDARLQTSGSRVGVAGTPVVVRNHDAACVRTETGPFMRSDLPIAGFPAIDAASIEEAMDMVSGTLSAVAHSVVEIWPLETLG